MKQVFLDTSFVMACAEWRVDFFSEIARIADFTNELVVFDRVVDELDVIIAAGGLRADVAKLAKTVLSRKQVKLLPANAEGTVDDLILANASKDRVVATMDTNLKRQLKAKGVPLIIVRQKKYLQFG
jgi:rRNA-processing protein FCF1